MTVVAVPVKGGRFKMITQLRTLAQLDSYFSHVKSFIFIMAINFWPCNQQAATYRSKSFIQPPVIKTAIKRKIGYEDCDDDGDVYIARRKMLNMAINEEYWDFGSHVITYIL